VSIIIKTAPILLFVYSRSNHTQRTVEALLQNTLAIDSDLIIYSDAARSSEEIPNVDNVRAYLKTIIGFRSITIYLRPYNFGLAKSIISGVSETLKNHDRVIVLEDDMLTSPYFLTYMNDGLNKYVADERIVSIHGWLFPTECKLPETFFLQGADCWGWATWQRGWEIFNPNGQSLLDEIRCQKLTKDFDCNGAYPYTKMLEGQIKGVNDSWAVRWHASAFLAKKLTLYPGRSLVHNIGNDGSGTHCAASDLYDTCLSQTPIKIENFDVATSQVGKNALEDFMRKSHMGLFRRLLQKFLFVVGVRK
jgi:hypothetical protein